MLYDLGELAKSKECTEKALATPRHWQQGNRSLLLRKLRNCFSDHAKAKDYFEKALVIAKETGYKKTEATSSLSLGILLKSLGDYSKSEKHLEKALCMTKKIGRQE